MAGKLAMLDETTRLVSQEKDQIKRALRDRDHARAGVPVPQGCLRPVRPASRRRWATVSGFEPAKRQTALSGARCMMSVLLEDDVRGADADPVRPNPSTFPRKDH